LAEPGPRLNTVIVDPDQRRRRTGESDEHVHEVPIRVFLCAQELRTSGIVPLKKPFGSF
jgi:hypothetical protein